MSRTIPSSAANNESAAFSLNRILARLEESILSPNADPSLRTSSFARAKANANIEYARSLLLRIEHDSAGIKIQSRKQHLHTDLQAKRNLIKQLNQRLTELDQLDDGGFDDQISDASDLEDSDPNSYPSYAPARAANGGIDREHNPEAGNPALHAAAEQLTSTLRSRRANPAASPVDTATTTSSALFEGHSKQPAGVSHLAQSERVLSENRMEQEQLTSSLLAMAQALKSQSVAFGQSLDSSNPILDQAAQGLDKSAQGMEAAEKRMGTLRRMTEGKGWWGRIMLYAWIFGLWVVAFLIVFVGPKLRF